MKQIRIFEEWYWQPCNCKDTHYNCYIDNELIASFHNKTDANNIKNNCNLKGVKIYENTK